MARLYGNLQFTGGLSNLTAYRMRGSDKIIVRSKGGASKEMILNSESFERTRENNLEWTGCSRAGKSIRNAIRPINKMADYNYSGPLNAIMKSIQKADTENARGERSVLISKHREFLNGFNLNIQNRWDGVVRSTISYTLDRTLGKAVIAFPPMIPGVNFQNRNQRPFFRFVVVLGVVSDVVYSGDYYNFRQLNQLEEKKPQYMETEWVSALKPFEGTSVEIAYEADFTPDDNDSYILGVGLEFGNPVGNNTFEPIRYSGSAKILAVV